jgi:predicted  nucleic acid-binding Zn-ribbon protein
MKTRIAYYFIGIVISALALTSVASLSTYAHETDTSLMATQAKLEALQKNYDQLKADHDALGKDYEQVKSDLETANGKVTALESDIQSANAKNAGLEQTIKNARIYMKALDGLFDESISMQEMDARITATGNSELRSKWNAVNDQSSLGSFMVYLVHTTWDAIN